MLTKDEIDVAKIRATKSLIDLVTKDVQKISFGEPGVKLEPLIELYLYKVALDTYRVDQSYNIIGVRDLRNFHSRIREISNGRY